jgi:hypothetical protein
VSADGDFGEVENVPADPDADQDDDFGLGSSLWDGDEGTLTEKQRDALVVLLKHEYISFDTYPHEFRTLVENPSPIRSMLNNLYLDLHLDAVREIAHKRPARGEGRKFRTILYDTAYNREETLLLVFLREQFRAEGAAGVTHVFVDSADMQEYVARFRPAHDTDESGGRRKVENAIASLKKAKLVTATVGSPDRFQISRAIEALLPVERLNALLEALRAQNQAGAAGDASSTPGETATEVPDV